MPDLSRSELTLIKDALESAKVEFEQLVMDNEWFISDVTDLQESAREIGYGHLGITPDKEEYDHYEE